MECIITSDTASAPILVVYQQRDSSGNPFPSALTAAELIPVIDGRQWEIVQDVVSTTFDVERLRFISFLKQGKPCVSGEVMRQRAVALHANFGLADGKCLLAVQDKIPVRLRGKYIILPGTLFRLPGGRFGVAYLYWGTGRWVLDFRWLGRNWSSGDVFPCDE